jgi:hypothetical protein
MCSFLLRTFSDPATFWAMVTAVATVIVTLVAYWQLRSLAQTSRSDFLYRLKKDFFTTEARQLIFLAEHDLMKFHKGKIPHFEIVGHDNPGVMERMKELGIIGITISTYAVDDALLGPMEDMGVLESMGLLSLKEIYEAFVTYINICVESQPLKEYLDFSRENPEDSDVYDHLLRLYKKLKAETPKIRKAKRSKLMG